MQKQVLDQIILQLKQIEVDGESMEYIIRETGLDVQLLRQLIMTGNVHTIRHFLDERIELMDNEKTRLMRTMKDQERLIAELAFEGVGEVDIDALSGQFSSVAEYQAYKVRMRELYPNANIHPSLR